MSIINAFNISRTGLSATSQWAEMVSGNIANADNESYGRRSLTRETMAGGAAVAIGVRRESDEALNRMYREELAKLERQEAIASGLTAYTSLLGGLGESGSPVQRLNELQDNFDLLFNDPSNVAGQQGTLTAAQSLASGLNTLSDELDITSKETRDAIGADLTQVNDLMTKVSGLNRRIAQASPDSELMATLQDQMSETLNALAGYMDFRTDTDNTGQIDLLTPGGLRLVEGETVYPISYTVGDGTLRADGADISPGTTNGLSEGRLVGHVELLNDTLPQMRLQLDEFARTVIETFEDADATLTPGDAGLFTDDGLAYDPAQLTGLAGRIVVNTAVMPDQGGALWRLRDGIGATAPGSAGSTAQIGAFIDGMNDQHSFDGATGISSDITLTEYGAAMIAQQQNIRAEASDQQQALVASTSSIDAARLNAQGVNIDDELQQLLLIEKTYAANSQVVSTLSQMLDVLLAAV